ncbi:MAG TPA: hypothetical protein DCS48_00600 [Desulfovibrio sp.]|nr:hypothetical protein [Desulfovibrio sp.]
MKHLTNLVTVTLTLILAASAYAQNPNKEFMMKTSELKSGVNNITFQSQGYKLAGLLFLPGGFSPDKIYPAVVITPPFNQVKEQAGSVYARKLAEQGFIALAFDHRGYGDSEGELRSYEYTPAFLEGIADAVSFLRMHNFVDISRVYGLGICAGATHIVATALTDKRFAAIATVSGMLNNQRSFFRTMNRTQAVATLKTANEARQKYYETGVQENVDLLGLGTKPAEDAPNVNKEGHDYYMTKRAGRKTYPNYTHMTPMFVNEDYPRYNAVTMAPNLYTPYLGIYGSKAMESTGPLTVAFYEAASEPKELYEVKEASHVSLYDIDKDVDRAVARMTDFFLKYAG